MSDVDHCVLDLSQELQLQEKWHQQSEENINSDLAIHETDEQVPSERG